MERTVTGSLTYPVARVKLRRVDGGEEWDITRFAESLSVNTTPWRAADTFSLSLALPQMPHLDGLQQRLSYGEGGSLTGEDVRQFILKGQDFEVMIYLECLDEPLVEGQEPELGPPIHWGRVDSESWSLDTGGLRLSLSGRDFVGLLLDKPLNDRSWDAVNRLDIIKELADEVGVKVDPEPTGFSDTNLIGDGDSSWSIIQRLAHDEGCIAYLQPGTRYLRLEKPPESYDPERTLVWSALADEGELPLRSLSVDRHPPAREKYKVTVTGYNVEKAEIIEAVADDERELPDSNLVEKRYRRMDLNDEKALRKQAQYLLNQLASYEVEVSAGLQGGALELRGGMMVKLRGTGGALPVEHKGSGVAGSRAKRTGRKAAVGFDGKYHLSKAAHSLGSGGLTTSLTLQPPYKAFQVD